MTQWISGYHAVAAVLAAGRRDVKGVYYSDTDPSIAALLQAAKAQGAAVRKVPIAELKRLVGEGLHQGLAAEVENYPYVSPDDVLKKGPSFLLALDEIQDPHNCGALLRSAFAFGVEGVLLSKDHTVAITPAAQRASAGASEFLPIVRSSGLPQLLLRLKKQGFWIIGADQEGTPVGECGLFSERLVMVMGSEGKGLREINRKACDVLVRIPIQPSELMDSLNVSVAGGILLWEIAKVKALLPR